MVRGRCCYAGKLMRTCKKCLVEKSESEFYKDAANKQGLRTVCKVCDRAQGKAYFEENKEKESIRNKKYSIENFQKIKDRKSRQREIDAEKIAEYSKKYYAENKEKRLKNSKAWYSKNAGTEHLAVKSKIKGAKRRAAKILAVAPWADKAEISKIYHMALIKSKESGIKYHVDHIIPLRGKLVCGLHVENNLQVITWNENLSKGARYSP